MAWALAHHRIFNARYMLASLGHRVAVVALLAVSAWGMALLLQQIMPATAGWIAGVFLCALAIFWIDGKTRTWLGLGEALLLSAFRSEVIGASKTEGGADRLVSEFERLLAQHFGSPFAVLLADDGHKYVGQGFEVPRQRQAVAALCECVWITPESLQRRRSNLQLEDLGALLRAHSLGVLVTIPRGSRKPAMLVGVGTKSNEWPFTYPEVQRLLNVGELMDNILTRARLQDQTVMRTKMQHLAMMSRGLAHDLKNLITPVSSFLVYADGRQQAGSTAEEVHASARRSIRLMTDYLREVMFFSDRLEPKHEPVDLPATLNRTVVVCAARASARGVTLEVVREYFGPISGDSVLLQRVLTNLVNNAIDASRSGQNVVLTASAGPPGWLRLQVVDAGCGIPTEIIDRVFEPYFTTKHFGDEVRGFGLGLPISQRIVHLLGGTIAVKSAAGEGTTVTVELPTERQPPSAPRVPAAAPAVA